MKAPTYSQRYRDRPVANLLTSPTWPNLRSSPSRNGAAVPFYPSAMVDPGTDTIKTPAALTRSDYDAVVCGASFAGLATARELAGTGMSVLLLDRYEIGQRQTSACATPTEWLDAMDLGSACLQTFSRLLIHMPWGTIPFELPWTFSTFDYPTLMGLLFAECDADFEVAAVEGLAEITSDGGENHRIVTNRGTVSARFAIDCSGWRGILRPPDEPRPPHAPMSRGLETVAAGTGREMELWIDPSLVAAGYGWSFPAGEEVRIGVGSYDPRTHVRRPTDRLTHGLGLETGPYHGNWIPHRLNGAVSRGVFFCGDSAGHTLPLTAEGIRTALYFGVACGREIRRVAEGRSTRELALARYDAFCRRHARAYDRLYRVQGAIPKLPPAVLFSAAKAMSAKRFVNWSFNRYLNVTHYAFAADYGAPAKRRGLPRGSTG